MKLPARQCNLHDGSRRHPALCTGVKGSGASLESPEQSFGDRCGRIAQEWMLSAKGLRVFQGEGLVCPLQRQHWRASAAHFRLSTAEVGQGSIRNRLGFPLEGSQSKSIYAREEPTMTNMNPNNAVVATHQSHAEAEAAFKELPPSGFDAQKLSIAGRDCQNSNK